MSTYHAYSFQYPTTHPYDNPDYRWTTFLGEFVHPVSTNRPEVLYWATHYGPTVEFKVFTDDLSGIESEINQLKATGFTITALNRTLEDDLGSPRFIGPASQSTRTNRSTLILKSLKSVCDLMLDSIVKRPDGYWEHEECGDKLQNPIGNHMFSVTHLYHLIASTDALVHPYVTPDDTLHLMSYYYYKNNKQNIGPHRPLQPKAVKM